MKFLILTGFFFSLANAKEFKPSVTYQWLDIAQEATAREVDRNQARPTIISRALAIILTGMFDAWSAYDEHAVSSLGNNIKQPPSERNDENKSIAMAYAAYATMLDVYGEDEKWIKEQMKKMGHIPTTNPTSSAGKIGIAAAIRIINYRQHDGANQLGDEIGGNGKPYSDYTYYSPVNSLTKVIDPDRWQQIPFIDPKGKVFSPGFLTPHWYRVKPFALEKSEQFRAVPPPKVGSPQLKAEVDENIKYNGSLSKEQKAIVEFMRDGPRSTGQSGHWLKFAQMVSKRDHHDLDKDIKLYFAVANVAMDAFIAAWETKRYYDTSRPWTLVRYYYKGKKILSWMGPGKGYGMIPAEEWHPYSPSNFVTPPFPGYVSGHSTVSAACSKTLELFTGSDHFGEFEVRKAGILTEADFPCNDCEVKLDLPTFSATAQMAGISRVMGGYHIQADNIEGLRMGRNIAKYSWKKYLYHFNGRTN